MKNNCFLPSRSFHLEEERDKLKKNYNKFILFIYLLTEGILLNNNS